MIDGSLASTGIPAPVSGNAFNAANQMTSFNGAALSYDANGNLTSDGTNTYAWDARNHLVGISGPTSASFVGACPERSRRNPFGRRVAKTINGVVTQFLYDRLNAVQELDGASPPNVTANILTGLKIDEYFSRTDSAGPATILADALGSTLGLTDASGVLDTTYAYEPFGNVTISGAANANSFQFTGRENDGTGLYYYRARYYSPKFQRFTSQDPIGFSSGGPNLYAYGSNNPLTYFDPLGLFDVPSAAPGPTATPGPSEPAPSGSTCASSPSDSPSIESCIK